MRFAAQETTLVGHVVTSDPGNRTFTLKLRTDDEIAVHVSVTTSCSVLRNLDGIDLDRVPEPHPARSSAEDPASFLIRKYIHRGETLFAIGVAQCHDGASRFEAKRIVLFSGGGGGCVFEQTHWWITQITQIADQWLEDLFDAKRSYKIDDFAKLYRTNLNIIGGPTDDNTQECATLSRLIYGLSSAYLLTGADRYRLAAQAGVEYLRQAFRSMTNDGLYCFWFFGRRKVHDGEVLLITSLNPDDINSIPLYEQIYALSGLAQYYRITLDPEVLSDLRRTMAAFDAFYRDDAGSRAKGFPGHGGYFSHLDYPTMRPDGPALGQNQSRKNWNSIGDHIPAYLINVILALDPLPPMAEFDRSVESFRDACVRMLLDLFDLIVQRFPDPASRYVNERFFSDWSPDHAWGWQMNRGVVGHNFKIAWNLLRCANFFSDAAAGAGFDRVPGVEDEGLEGRAATAVEFSRSILEKMSLHGFDPIRGGVFDCVERMPDDGQPMQFVWGSTKDFWQQEQGLLACLVLYGATGDQAYLAQARECAGFWNAFFLDHDNRGVFFRVSECGQPVIEGAYAQKAAHAVAGYHSFELNYLAHVYMRTFVSDAPGAPDGSDRSFTLYFRVAANSTHRAINVLPDFLPARQLSIVRVSIGGVGRAPPSPGCFQLPLTAADLDKEIAVAFGVKARSAGVADDDTREHNGGVQ